MTQIKKVSLQKQATTKGATAPKENQKNQTTQSTEVQPQEQDAEITLLPFPIKTLPLFIQEICLGLDKGNDFPIEFTATSLLAILPIIYAKHTTIHAKLDWDLNPNSLFLLVGRSTLMKSAPMNWCIRHLEDIDDQQQDVDIAVRETTFFKSATIEKAMKIASMQKQYGTLAYFDEFSRWYISITKKNAGLEKGEWLDFVSSGKVKKERVGEGKNAYTKNAFVNFLAATQTEVLIALLADDKNLDDGFLYRFNIPLILHRDKKTFRELEKSEPLYIDNATGKSRMQIKYIEITQILESLAIDYASIDGFMFTLSTDAKELYFTYDETLNERINQTIDHRVNSLYSRSLEKTIKLCLLLQPLFDAEKPINNTPNSVISKECMHAAIALSEYYQRCSLYLMREIAEKQSVAFTAKINPMATSLNWNLIFNAEKGERELKTNILIKRIQELKGVGYERAKQLVYSELQKVTENGKIKQGYWKL